ncbi:kinase-like domain-containing protein [Suillus ampliporus]|nr:kinase-like domain-containing protein [Suillus ampliporus]
MFSFEVLTVAHQWASCSTGSSQVIIGFPTLQRMFSQLQKANEDFEKRCQMMEAAIVSQQMGVGLTGPLTHQSFLPPSLNIARSTQFIPPIPIPDLTGLITRCSQDPVSGGSYGNIYKCIYCGPDGDVEVAVKAIRPQFIGDEVFRRELGIWKRLRHSSILKFMGTTSDFGPSVALVAPWIANGTLTSFLKQNNETLALLDRLRLLHDVAAGLNYLHTFSLTEDGRTDLNPVIHGDLTGTNVLVDQDKRAYLADFGLSGTLKQSTGMTYLAKMSCHPGAMRWAAPELLTGEDSCAVTTQSDIYSFGNIMLQVLTGNVPWPHLTREAAILRKVIFEGEIHPRPNDSCITDQHWNFMTRCWVINPTDRPSAKAALQFVDRELRLNGGLVAGTPAVNDHRSPLSSRSSSSRSHPYARTEHFPGAPPHKRTVVSIAGPSGINSLQQHTLVPGLQWMDHTH